MISGYKQKATIEIASTVAFSGFSFGFETVLFWLPWQFRFCLLSVWFCLFKQFSFGC
jgi:hypothetical protein